MRLFEIGQKVTYRRDGEPDQEVIIVGGRLNSGHYHVKNEQSQTLVAFEDNLFINGNMDEAGKTKAIPTYNILTGEKETPEEIARLRGEATPEPEPEPEPEQTTAIITLDDNTLEGLTAYTMPMIEFNKQSLIDYANSVTNKYKGLILTEDNEPEIKAINTQLNKAQKTLNQKRLDIEKVISGPIKQFKADIDEVIQIFATVQEDIKKQLDSSKAAQQAERKAEVQILFDSFMANLHLPDNYKQMVILKAEYYTTKKTNKYIREDIEGQIAEVTEQYNTAVKLQTARDDALMALMAAYPDINVTAADLVGIPTANLWDWFNKKRMALQATIDYTAPVAPVFNAPINNVKKEEKNLPKTDGFMLRFVLKAKNQTEAYDQALIMLEKCAELGITVDLEE